MKGWITLTHAYSGDKFHVKVDKITAFRETEKGRVLIIIGKDGSWVVETMEEIAFLMGGGIMPRKVIKYRHLWAWDTMMGSYQYWKDMMQAQAEEENAPLTAIFKDSSGRWHTYEEIESEETKERIDQILNMN